MESSSGNKSVFRLNLLGEFELRTSTGASLAISAKKSKALLAYLALSRNRTCSRDRIATLLWSDTELTFAKTNLRQCLSALRKQIDNKNNPLILSKADQLTLDPTRLELDVDKLRDLEEQTSPAGALNKIRALERGKFLHNFPSVDAEFDRWLVEQRTSYANQYRSALEKFLDVGSVDSSEVKCLAKALLTVEPENEKAHIWLVKYYLKNSDRIAALRQYETCRTALATQLDVTPGPELSRLYHSIRQSNTVGNSNPEDEIAISPAAVVSTHVPATTCFVQRRSIWLRAAMLAITVLIATTWRFTQQTTQPTHSGQGVVQKNGNLLEQHTLTANEKPLRNFQQQYSIAVIPFRDLSESPDQTYLSDGISDDLVTEISRVSGLTVIASESSFRFRDQHDNIEQLTQQLPVDYVLSGSVRRLLDQLRINVHLIRTSDNSYVWSDKIDRDMKDLLRVQDEITRHIVASLSIELTETEWQRLLQHREVSPEAYDLLLRGLHPFSQFTDEGVSSARDYFLQSIRADPNYARPYANMALSFGREVVFQFAEPDPESIRIGLEYADKADTLDPSLPQTQFARAVLHLANREYNLAIAAARKSISIDPNYADGFAVLAQTLGFKGELDEALEAVYKAKFLNPIVPFTYKWVEGHILYQLRRYDDARVALEAVYDTNPSFYIGLLSLSATYGQLGEIEEAEWINAEILTHKADFSAEIESEESPYLMKQHRQHLLQGLTKAGLPR